MNTAQIIDHPARNGGILVDRVTELRRERDELLAANEYQTQEIERLLRELDAMRALQPKPGLMRRFIAWVR